MGNALLGLGHHPGAHRAVARRAGAPAGRSTHPPSADSRRNRLAARHPGRASRRLSQTNVSGWSTARGSGTPARYDSIEELIVGLPLTTAKMQPGRLQGGPHVSSRRIAYGSARPYPTDDTEAHHVSPG